MYSSESTIKPRLEIGLPSTKSGKKVKGFYGYFQEVGSSKTPKMGLLQNAVNSNVATIIEIESQYLSALKDEAEALNLMATEAEIEVGDE